MRKELRDGLMLRNLSEGIQTDQERLPAFYKRIFLEEGDTDAKTLDRWLVNMIERHPQMALDDFFVVVDTADDDKIVSATCLIPQVWRYADVEFTVGRPEFVATDKAYRRRGLVRELMNAVHDRSESLGHAVQAITGIPHYYRRFGYAMAVDLGRKAIMPYADIPKLAPDAERKFTIRRATDADVPQLVTMEREAGSHGLLSSVWTADYFRYNLSFDDDILAWRQFYMIDNAQGEAIGYLVMSWHPEQKTVIRCLRYHISAQASYLETFVPVMQAVKAMTHAEDTQCSTMYFASNIDPRLLQLIEYTAGGKRRDSTFAWYMRVPDLGKFMMQIAPVLERRLHGSVAHGFSGTYKIGLYNFTHLSMTFENGQLKNAEVLPSDETTSHDGEMAFQTLLNIIFGHRTFREIFHVLPDVWMSRKGAILADTLFPKKHHSLLLVD